MITLPYRSLFDQLSVLPSSSGLAVPLTMAPQISIPVAANVLGTIGTVLWCVQLTPQIWHNWKKKKTDGLPGLMMFLFAACKQPCLSEHKLQLTLLEGAVPFGAYSIVQVHSVPWFSFTYLTVNIEFQHPNSSTAPGFRRSLLSKLGTNSYIQQVRTSIRY